VAASFSYKRGIVEHVAGVEDYQVALATYRAACERWQVKHRKS